MPHTKELHDALARLLTEQRNPDSRDLDWLSTEESLRLINAQDKLVPLAVEREIPYIAEAVEIIVHALKNGGRLMYFGAGTSGRLGVVDASECPPTFGTDPGMVRGIIAGGQSAMFKSQEGAEDDPEQARFDVDGLGINARDVVCGIAASRRTPYVVSAVQRARELGARTIYITTNPRSEFDIEVDVAICPEVGPEVLMGSTRMKSGTAQKLVLNMLTTVAMVKLGKVYENMMVDLQLTNRKLVERAKRIIALATGISYERASEILEQSGGHVKTGIVMAAVGVSPEEARRRIAAAGGTVRDAIALNAGPGGHKAR
ncbi:MAG TPA: N-acetylmuramic acid 6-phosphate etherase [Bacteroidota bacterium]|nr:N-acetylmuramic acid 6-phosphate etherase [Bacteroidota bacterium]